MRKFICCCVDFQVWNNSWSLECSTKWHRYWSSYAIRLQQTLYRVILRGVILRKGLYFSENFYNLKFDVTVVEIELKARTNEKFSYTVLQIIYGRISKIATLIFSAINIKLNYDSLGLLGILVRLKNYVLVEWFIYVSVFRPSSVFILI